MITSEEEARAYCARLADPDAMARLERYIAMLEEENCRQNLVSAASFEHVWQRHIADSLQLLAHVPPASSPWLDLGSGAGLPGLVIAIARTDIRVCLVESRRRRADWLRAAAIELGLPRCEAIGDRLEDVSTFNAAVISARAFAPLGRLLALSGRFSTPDTVWVLPKGLSASKELAEQEPAVRAMFHVERSATNPEAGLLIGRGRPATP